MPQIIGTLKRREGEGHPWRIGLDQWAEYAISKKAAPFPGTEKELERRG